MSKRFNIRVYAILVNEENEVLVTDEFRFGKQFTKFPGGGLEHGEGTKDCIMRECMEEMGQAVEVLEHFYTTDFYQESAFRSDDQIFSVYYRVKLLEGQKFTTKSREYDFDELIDGAQTFRWIDLDHFSESDLTFPIDKKVAGLLQRWNG